MEYQRLQNPLEIRGRRFTNRIVMPPLVIWQSDESAEVKEAHLRHFRNSLGPGLMILEATVVSPEGRLSDRQLGIFEDRHIEGLAQIVELIHENCTLAGIQIHHAGLKSSPEISYGNTPLAPSVDGFVRPVSSECRELSIEDIKRIEEDFAKAARRAVEAGFDYIELHGAHGYLINQFLSPMSNTREDEYGDSLENRQRFLMETFAKCREAVDGKALMSCRLGLADKELRRQKTERSASDTLGGTEKGRTGEKGGERAGSAGPRKPPLQGLSLEEGLSTAERLEKEGADLLNISHAHGIYRSAKSKNSPFSPVLHLAAAAKQCLTIPVIGIGDILLPEDAEKALSEGMADLIAVGRSMLADPAWARKTLEGRSNEINRCVRCKPCHWFKDPSLCPPRKRFGPKAPSA